MAEQHRRVRPATIALVAWLAVCALIASARWTWPGELAVHFQPFVGLAGVVLAAGLVASKRRRAALGTAILSLVLLAPMARFLPRGGQPRYAGPSLRVASLNLHRERPAKLDLEGWLARHEVDLIAFQEVSPPTLARLREWLGTRGRFEILPADEADWVRGVHGQVFFSRLPVVSLERVHGGWRGPAFFVAEVLFAGGELQVIAAQPMRPGRTERNRARDEQLAAIARLAARQPRSVVLGDLNTTSFAPAFGELLERGKLRDSRLGIGWQPSFAPFEAVPLPLLATDHVLLGDGLVVLSRELTENIGSDHWPVLATLAAARGSRAALSRP